VVQGKEEKRSNSKGEMMRIMKEQKRTRKWEANSPVQVVPSPE
jgi:hypothetical protein